MHFVDIIWMTERRKTEHRMTEHQMTEHRIGPNIEWPNIEWPNAKRYWTLNRTEHRIWTPKDWTPKISRLHILWYHCWIFYVGGRILSWGVITFSKFSRRHPQDWKTERRKIPLLHILWYHWWIFQVRGRILSWGSLSRSSVVVIPKLGRSKFGRSKFSRSNGPTWRWRRMNFESEQWYHNMIFFLIPNLLY